MTSETAAPPPAKRKSRSILRILGGFFLVLVISVLIILSTGNRRIPFLESSVERRLAETVAPYGLTGEKMTVRLNYDEGLKFGVNWKNAALREPNGEEILHFPAMTAQISMWPLLVGNVKVSKLRVEDALLRIERDAQGKLQLAFAPSAPSAEPPAARGMDALREIGSRVRGIDVIQSRLLLVNEGEPGQTIDIPLIRMRMSANKLRLALGLAPENAPPNNLRLELDRAGEGWTGRLFAEGFTPGTLAPLAPRAPVIAGLTSAISGTLSFDLDAQDRVTTLGGRLEQAAGLYTNPALFHKPLPIDRLSLDVAGAAEGEGFTLSKINAALKSGEVEISTEGTAHLEKGELTAALDVIGNGMDIPRIGDFWPLTLAPNTRHWVTTRMTAGHAGKTICHVRLKPGDLAQRFLPTSVIAADIPVQKATIRYIEKMPVVTGVDAMVHITGTTLDAEVSAAGSFTASKVRKAHVRIPDFNDPTLPLQVALDVDGPATDVAAAMAPERLDIGAALKLDPETIQGDVHGVIDLDMILNPEEAGPVMSAHSIVNYKATADMTGVAQAKVLGKWDVQGLDAHFTGETGMVHLKGKATLQGVLGKLTLHHQEEPRFDEYHWVAAIPAAKLESFGPHLPEGVGGVLGVDALIHEEDGQLKVKAEVGLDDAVLDIKQLRYKKAAGTKAHLGMVYTTASDDDGSGYVPKFRYQSEGEEIEGTLRFASGRELTLADLSKVLYAGSDLKLRYQKKGEQQTLSMAGDRLDVSPWWNDNDKKSRPRDEDPLDLFEHLIVSLGVAEIRFGEQRLLRKLRGDITCAEHCHKAAVNATTDSGKQVTYRLSQRHGKRYLAVQSDDAGELIRVLGYSPHVKGGDLTLEGAFDDQAPKRPLKARVMMNDFRMQDAPALTRILSLASLTGMADTVSGKGIRFARLSGDVTYTRGDLLLKDVKALGPALGVLLDGAIDNDGEMALSGTLVPSYTINSLVGKIPLIGNAIVGGEGEGLVGARFSVKGTIDKPDVSVNPLSVLTPGFLRNIFNIGKDNPEESAKKLNERKLEPDEPPLPLPPPDAGAATAKPGDHDEAMPVAREPKSKKKSKKDKSKKASADPFADGPVEVPVITLPK